MENITKKLLFTGTVKELKNFYTIKEDIPEEMRWIKRPIMKKVLFNINVPKPTAYKIYRVQISKENTIEKRTWCWGENEINIGSKEDLTNLFLNRGK